MTSKSGAKLLTELLNIEGIKVISKRQHEGIGTGRTHLNLYQATLWYFRIDTRTEK